MDLTKSETGGIAAGIVLLVIAVGGAFGYMSSKSSSVVDLVDNSIKPGDGWISSKEGWGGGRRTRKSKSGNKKTKRR